jgi:hypothetical protein
LLDYAPPPGTTRYASSSGQDALYSGVFGQVGQERDDRKHRVFIDRSHSHETETLRRRGSDDVSTTTAMATGSAPSTSSHGWQRSSGPSFLCSKKINANFLCLLSLRVRTCPSLDRPSPKGRHSPRRSGDVPIGAPADLVEEIERDRFPVSLWLLRRLAVEIDERPHSLHVEVADGFRGVSDVDPCELTVTSVPDDRGDQRVRWVGRVAQTSCQRLPLRPLLIVCSVRILRAVIVRWSRRAMPFRRLPRRLVARARNGVILAWISAGGFALPAVGESCYNGEQVACFPAAWEGHYDGEDGA